MPPLLVLLEYESSFERDDADADADADTHPADRRRRDDDGGGDGSDNGAPAPPPPPFGARGLAARARRVADLIESVVAPSADADAPSRARDFASDVRVRSDTNGGGETAGGDDDDGETAAGGADDDVAEGLLSLELEAEDAAALDAFLRRNEVM